MNPQQEMEAGYWRGVVEQMGIVPYLEFRTGQDANDKLCYFQDIYQEKGRGLDYGCALVSIFTKKDLDVDAFDPLIDEYDKIYKPEGKIKYYNTTAGLKDSSYDFVFCCNVIDHTPDPWVIVNDIHRLLKPGGKLYFEVHFDPTLAQGIHSTLWRIPVVREHFTPKMFKLIREEVYPGSFEGQKSYQAVYEVVT